MPDSHHTCRRCGADSSNGFCGLCESCEEADHDQYGPNCDHTDYD